MDEQSKIILKFEYTDEFGYTTKMEKQLVDSYMDTLIGAFGDFLKACEYEGVEDHLYLEDPKYVAVENQEDTNAN